MVRLGGGRSLSAVLAGQRGDAPVGRAQRCGLVGVEHLPGAPIPLRHSSSRPAGECAGSENRRVSAASNGAPASHQPRRLDAWLARRSTTPTSRAGRSSASPPVAAAALPVPRRRRAEPGRGTAGPGPRGLPADRRRARSAAARRTRRARGPVPEHPVVALAPQMAVRVRCPGGGASRRRRAGDRPLGRVRLGVGCSPATGRRAGRRASGATPSASIGFDLRR